MQLLPCLLAPVLWERPANVSPLVRLLSAFAKQAAPQIVAQDKLVRNTIIATSNSKMFGYFCRFTDLKINGFLWYIAIFGCVYLPRFRA